MNFDDKTELTKYNYGAHACAVLGRKVYFTDVRRHIDQRHALAHQVMQYDPDARGDNIVKRVILPKKFKSKPLHGMSTDFKNDLIFISVEHLDIFCFKAGSWENPMSKIRYLSSTDAPVQLAESMAAHSFRK